MDFFLNILQVIALVLSFIYAVWPLIILAPLGWRRGNVLRGMGVAWGFALLSYLATLAISEKPVSFLIPEPLNSYLFFGAGVVLAGLIVGRGMMRRRKIVATAETARSPGDLLTLSPAQFEDMVVEYYRLRGAKASRTGASGDHGVDVVVETPKGEKWVVQCKRWRGWVGEPEVRDFYGALQHEKAHRGVLITTGTFSNAARAWAKGKPLVLADGRAFLKAWREANRS